MKKINDKRQLPASFSLDKYSSLESLSDKDLFRQLYWRIDSLSDVGLDDFGLCVGSNYPLNENYGDPFDEMHNPVDEYYKHKEKPDILKISNGIGLRALNRFDVAFFKDVIAEDGYASGHGITLSEEHFYELMKKDNGEFWAAMMEPVSLIMPKEQREDLYLAVNLSVPDDLLIEDFSKLLNTWRAELGVSASKPQISGRWPVIRKKILSYKTIPMIDLLSWALSTNSTITDGVLAVSLFPNDGDSVAIGQTMKPFARKILDSDFLEKLRREISSNS